MVFKVFLRCPRACTVVDHKGHDDLLRGKRCTRRVDVQIDVKKGGGNPHT